MREKCFALKAVFYSQVYWKAGVVHGRSRVGIKPIIISRIKLQGAKQSFRKHFRLYAQMKRERSSKTTGLSGVCKQGD